MQAHSPKAFVGKTAEGLEDLSLPILEASHGIERDNRQDLWRSLTYEMFAEQVIRKNPDRVLTKDIMDNAFTSVVERMNRNARGWRGRDSAMVRVCSDLHTESHEALLILEGRYWAEKARDTGKTNESSSHTMVERIARSAFHRWQFNRILSSINHGERNFTLLWYHCIT